MNNAPTANIWWW